MSLAFYTVDAFTQRSFAGNPAAVVVLPSPPDGNVEVDDALCQTIAKEFNLAETAFLRRLDEGRARHAHEDVPNYELRWWTPTYEIPLCGHATLASAHVLFTHYHPRATRIEFSTRSRGSLTAVRDRSTGSIALDLPKSSLVTLEEGHRRRGEILRGVEKVVERDDVVRIDWADEIAACVVELSDRVDLEHLEFDPFVLISIGEFMIILTQPAPVGSGFDIHSRVFGPDVEVPEDPVTGSAHTALAPFWISGPSLSRLRNPENVARTSTLRAKQVSKRGGELLVSYDEDKGRVELRGWAKEVMSGQLTL